MALVAVRWSDDDLAREAGIGAACVRGFLVGEYLGPDRIEKLKQTLERTGVRFVENGPERGAVVPPRPAPIGHLSGSIPLLPRSRLKGEL